MQNYKPIKYLERDKEDIIEKLASDIHTHDEANVIYHLANDFIKRLTAVRESENKTISILNEIKELDVDVARSLRRLLIDSIDEDNSFYYAYNQLIQYSNRYHGTDFFVKYGISRKMILRMIDEEKASKNESSEVVFQESKINLHQHIFTGTDSSAFDFFEKLKNAFKIPPERETSQDLNFIFTKMKKDKLICDNIGPSDFKNWLMKTYPEEFKYLIKIKDSEGDTRVKEIAYESIYSNYFKLKG